MLDSSSGKLLSTKPVEAPISADIQTGTNASEQQSSKGAISTLHHSLARTAKTEAEVRFIVRVIAEEHIVIDGQVKQVKHLDEVKMLRGVSRIVWDGAKEENKLATRDEGIDKVANIGLPEQDSSPESADENSLHRTNPHQSINDVVMIEASQDSPKNISRPEHLTHNDTISSPGLVVPNDNEGVTPAGESQSETNMDKNDLACDTETSTFISNANCETRDHQEKSSYTVEEICNQDQLIGDKSIGVKLDQEERLDEISELKQEEAGYCSVDSQMIVDTLNDCVLNVDRECRRNESLDICNEDEHVKKDDNVKIKVEPSYGKETTKTIGFEGVNSVQHNETSYREEEYHVVEIDKKPHVEDANIPPNNESTQETVPINSDINRIRDNDAQANETANQDLSARRAPNKNLDNSGSSASRRNPSDNGSTSKRVRRVNSKDQSKTCRNSRRTENSMVKRNKSVLSDTVANEHECYFSNQSRILAKWSDNHFYPGTISRQKGDRKFEVTFYDGARKDIADTDLIPVPNILGKQVRITIAEGYCVNAVVLDQLSSNGQPMFDVEYNQNGLVKKRVPLDDVFLTAEQGIPLINQPIKPDKNPDESMFAGVDLDNIVPFKRSRRLQEMEEFEPNEDIAIASETPSNINGNVGRRKKTQYNTRDMTIRVRSSNIRADLNVAERVAKKSLPDVSNQDTPASSCSPETLKTILDSSTSNSPSGSSSSREANKF